MRVVSLIGILLYYATYADIDSWQYAVAVTTLTLILGFGLVKIIQHIQEVRDDR